LKALIIDEPWIGLILAGSKTWEMRKTGCTHRGLIALIKKGSGQIVGTAEVVDSLKPIVSSAEYAQAEPKHGIPPARQAQAFNDGWRTPWVLANARALGQPVPYSHPSGAVIWVNLDQTVSNAVQQQSGTLNGKSIASVHASILGAPAPVKVATAGSAREVAVTGGNIRNGHIYLPLDFFPDDAIGGSNKASAAPREITVVFKPGSTLQTDIDRTKRIIRGRGAMADFFVRANIVEGDKVRITRTAPHTFVFEKA
jgi:hypothetical protein